MSSPYLYLLRPPDWCAQGLELGTFALNAAANRVIDVRTGRFVAALVPGRALLEHAADQPLRAIFKAISSANPLGVLDSVTGVVNALQLSSIRKMLGAMQLVVSAGALASVANLGVSCVGFGLVMRRLSVFEDNIQAALHEVAALRAGVQQLSVHVEALALGRLRSAGESLARSLRADSAEKRLELCARARDLFQEAKHVHFELWRRSQPWLDAEVSVYAALGMTNCFAACAIGEAQAEFVSNDMGAFRHALESALADFAQYRVPKSEALHARSDAALREGCGALARFRADEVGGALQVAASAFETTAARLQAMTLDATLPAQLGLEAFEVARLIQDADGDTVYALPLDTFGHSASFLVHNTKPE
jgi:hypothetical protein